MDTDAYENEKRPPVRFFSQSEPESTVHSPLSSEDGSPSFKSSEDDSKNGKTKKLGRKSSSFAFRVRDHVKMGSKFSETVKGKLSLGAKIVQEGGRENIFKQVFGAKDGEKLLKASQCYLSTSAGPISGLLFISNEKVAFCSDRSFAFPSPDRKIQRVPYKVLIPIGKIKSANQSENMKNPAQKFIEIHTEDNYEFWFMGFLRYEKAYKNLEKAIEMANQMQTTI
ncbi:hypothetical protein MLD38_032881 [Melastoma candidum]|uniref:Uncharacterized protein n=1 Tax=Melastoma candidum TaxID=119954 RepID=A0ACB9M4T0_9MYRT|nr:hypothetical protein MLD38_032881 [Melastoma candidum]